MALQDTDILLVNRGSTSYKETYKNLKDAIVATVPAPSTPDLQAVTTAGNTTSTGATFGTNGEIDIEPKVDGSLNGYGSISLLGANNGSNECFAIKDGSTTRVSLKGDGSGDFAGNVVSGPSVLTSTTEYGFISPGYIEVRGNNDQCLGIFDQSDLTANISLNADGSLDAAGGAFSVGGTGSLDIDDGNGRTFISSATGTTFIGMNSAGTAGNIELNADGSASFANTVQSPSFFGNNTGNSQVWVGGASTSIITADGSATFAGDIQAAGLTDGTTTKTMTEVLAAGGVPPEYNSIGAVAIADSPVPGNISFFEVNTEYDGSTVGLGSGTWRSSSALFLQTSVTPDYYINIACLVRIA